MSTLPRTRSLGRADGSTLSLKRDRNRPTSLCESSWVRINASPGQEDHQLLRQEVLRRTPSQANNLCTTVPTSLVNRNLGGRHVPTRNSLRHSRMIVASKASSKGIRHKRQWSSTGRDLGRIGPLVITAQILVGIMGIVLAVWFVLWTPFLKFREVPHYASVPVFLSGIFGAILLRCTNKTKNCLSNFLKILVVLLCCISIVTCVCACIFSAFHLMQLAPMECTQRNKIANIAILPASSQEGGHPSTNDAESIAQAGSRKPQKLEVPEDDIGSGFFDQDDEDLSTRRTVAERSTSAVTQKATYTNASDCVCEKVRYGWRTELVYPNLSCGEVKNILPVLLVATCVVSAVGATLSGVILYILWMARRTFPRTANPSELRPIIYKSRFKSTKNHNGSLTNGSLYR